MSKRNISQVIAFLFLVVLVSGGVSSFKLFSLDVSCPLGALQTVIASRTFIYSVLAGTLFWVVLTFLFGRVFCSWVCPVGTITEHGGKFVPKIKRTLPGGHRNTKYGLLASVLFSSGLLRCGVFCPICPLGVTCRSVSWQGLGIGPESLVVPLLLAIETGESRSWCRNYCPVGGLFGLISLGRVFGLRINRNKCKSCKSCVRVCSETQMGIISEETLQSGLIPKVECNTCLECKDVCPQGAIEFGFGGKVPPRK